MRKWKKTLTIMTAVFLLTGCGGAETPDMDVFSLQKDGTIRHTMVGVADRNYYDEAGVEELVQQRIDQRNVNEGAIICESVEVKDGNFIVKMKYQTGEDYVRYIRRELFCGTVGEAIEAGYSLKDLVDQEGNAINEEELSEISEDSIVIIQVKDGEKLNVNVYDNILYTSGNITLSGKKDAVIVTQEKEDVLSYIVF
ncbi:MAG: hypothetical protein NC314_06670 [Roseburia sp.]|nr:hypothetical protein [Roseburia sp.]MCM1242509.1 hypothetical protein [Roseburia sp.]